MCAKKKKKKRITPTPEMTRRTVERISVIRWPWKSYKMTMRLARWPVTERADDRLTIWPSKKSWTGASKSSMIAICIGWFILSFTQIYVFKVVENLLDSRLEDGGDYLVSERALSFTACLAELAANGASRWTTIFHIIETDNIKLFSCICLI